MSDYIFILLILLSVIAIVLRADFLLTLIYLLAGVFMFGRWWSRRAIESIVFRRDFTDRVFLGEKIPVRLEIKNTGLLPVVWLQIHESLPAELVITGFFRRVFSLGPKGIVQFEYSLEGRKRGYYLVGPLYLHSGDLFGLAADNQLTLPAGRLTVYPKIVPFTRVKLPSRSPLGTLRHTQPIYEDPSRVLGKRDYVAGDSLRRVDWKSSAAIGRLQVKLFEPSIALETAIFLNLNAGEYDYRFRVDATELAIVVAASLANWVVGQRQAVGLVTNGLDPIQEDTGENCSRCPQPVPPRRGRGHLMRILDVLARVQVGETSPLVELLRRESVSLSWGTTLILITPCLDEDLFDGLFQARRSGLDIVLIPCGPVPDFEEHRRRAEFFGFPLYQILKERDLDLWRR